MKGERLAVSGEDEDEGEGEGRVRVRVRVRVRGRGSRLVAECLDHGRAACE